MFFDKFKRNTHKFFRKKDRVPRDNTMLNKQGSSKFVLVLLDDDEDREYVERELRHFFGQDAFLNIVVFKEKVSRKERLKYITPYDFKWFGGISKRLKEKIVTKKYNLLINYCKEDYMYVKSLLLHCYFDFAISYAQIDNELYDMQVDCDVEYVKIFTDEVKKYLKILNK